ncbi:MAG TPA: fibronectin type III domain-containing protein [Candidatus Manganitrophaceae bacterium]|nr:fibronectin type III domain-containing protein [Candidatus Manganitrophaceae bacterium]
MRIRTQRFYPFLLCFSLFLFSRISLGFAFDAVLSWSPNADLNLAGYKLYYGQAARTYGTPVDVGNRSAYTLTGLGPGTYYFALTAYDLSGAESDFSNEVSKTFAASPAADAAPPAASSADSTTADPPPVITAVLSAELTGSGSVITWITDQAATSQVEYGTTSSYGSESPLDAAPATSHSVALNGLIPSTTYHYRVKSTDAAGKTATSADHLFATLSQPDDSQGPSPGGGGGCAMITRLDGTLPALRQAAEIPALLGIVLLMLLKKAGRR